MAARDVDILLARIDVAIDELEHRTRVPDPREWLAFADGGANCY